MRSTPIGNRYKCTTLFPRSVGTYEVFYLAHNGADMVQDVGHCRWLGWAKHRLFIWKTS